MNNYIKEVNGYQYLDQGKGPVLLLLHGLFGALSNWEGVTQHFSKDYRVVIPMMPIYEGHLKPVSVIGLLNFLEGFIETMSLKEFDIIGNSLGGHVALIYTLRHQEKVNSLVLTGSSGLFENTMGGSYPKRGDYDFIKTKVEYTFYDPKVATKELVSEVFKVINSIPKCMRIIGLARSAQKHNMAEELGNINVPTLLIWGLNDTITPPYVAHEFHRLIPDSELRFIDKCGHAPMMEHSERFNSLVDEFFEKAHLSVS